MSSDLDLDRVTSRYPEPEMSPAEFESFVVHLLRSMSPAVSDLRVALLDRIKASDGSYVFDATMRFRLLGMDYLTVVEAKRHTHAIKRDVVQVLHRKRDSVGAQKALVVSTAPFQRGAVEYAATHGIALVNVTEGRFTYHTRSAAQAHPLTRQLALERHGIPEFVAFAYEGVLGRATRASALDCGDPELLLDVLFGGTLR